MGAEFARQWQDHPHINLSVAGSASTLAGPPRKRTVWPHCRITGPCGEDCRVAAKGRAPPFGVPSASQAAECGRHMGVEPHGPVVVGNRPFVLPLSGLETAPFDPGVGVVRVEADRLNDFGECFVVL